MQRSGRPLLEHLKIFHSCSAAETDAFLQGKRYRFDVHRGDAQALDARINGVYMPGAYIGYVQYGAAQVALSPGPERAEYWIQLPLTGGMKAVLDGDELTCDSGHAAIVSPVHAECRLTSEPHSTRLQLAVTKASVEAQLEAMLGRVPDQPLVFDPGIDLTRGHGQRLARYVLTSVLDLDQAAPARWSALAASAFEQSLVSALLEGLKHNHADLLQPARRRGSSRDVRRAVDFIEANLDAAITLGDIVRAAGVPGRTLFQHFRDFLGATPMQYLRAARLREVRQTLIAPEPDMSVTDVALQWGFTHAGRFSVEYRRRYGESPSATLRKGLRRL